MNKPRKKYKPKSVLMPKIIPLVRIYDKYPELALRFQLMTTAFINEPSTETANQISREVCIICGALSHFNKGDPLQNKTDAHSIAIKSAIYTLENIVDRHDRTGKVALTSSDKESMRVAAGKLDEALSMMPARCYEVAMFEVDTHLEVA